MGVKESQTEEANLMPWDVIKENKTTWISVHPSLISLLPHLLPPVSPPSPYLSVPPPPGVHAHRLVSLEQHRSWGTLGFIRSIALLPQMCSTLSTSAWIGLLIRIVEGHQSFNAVTLQRQVGCHLAGAFGVSNRSFIGHFDLYPTPNGFVGMESVG